MNDMQCLFLFDEHARLGSPRRNSYTTWKNSVKSQDSGSNPKRKYEAYYCEILQQMAATTTDVEQVNKQLEALHLLE
ncbi:MAG: hypothetical protein ACLU4N_14655 [Butyricimonas faecihominis]